MCYYVCMSCGDEHYCVSCGCLFEFVGCSVVVLCSVCTELLKGGGKDVAPRGN